MAFLIAPHLENFFQENEKQDIPIRDTRYNTGSQMVTHRQKHALLSLDTLQCTAKLWNFGSGYTGVYIFFTLLVNHIQTG